MVRYQGGPKDEAKVDAVQSRQMRLTQRPAASIMRVPFNFWRETEHTTSMPKSIIKITPADLEFEVGSFPPEWVLSGNSEMRSKLLLKTPDLLVHVVAWECGAVSYKWHYANDEAYIVLSGEGFMTDEKGVERRFAAGDVAFFPAGTTATWRHPDHFRKVAFLKESVGRPVGVLIKVFCKILRATRLKGRLLSILTLIALAEHNKG